MTRELPKLNIMGTEFFVDIQLQEFRQTDNPYNKILFDDLTDDGKDYLILYDLEKKNLHADSVVHKKMPEHILWLKIPSLFILDPVGMARVCGRPDHTFLSKYTPEREIIAEPIPIKKILIQKTISSNLFQ